LKFNKISNKSNTLIKRQPLQLEEVPRLQPPALPLDKAAVVGKKVFISHRAQEPDFSLAVQLCEALNASGHQAFTATLGANFPPAPLSEEDWFAHIDTELKQCDYFLLLLSPQAAVSEMVIEELRRAKELRDSPSNQKLVVLPIRVNCPLSAPLNHDLRSYLQGIGQRE
jgi:hypothetical protein